MPGWHISGGGGGAGGSGDVVGPASSTDNAIVRFDLATGKLVQNSDVTISDLAAGAVTITAGKGTAITLKNTDPDATTGASVAGDVLSITAGNAVASTDTAGAAVGGHVVATGGAAARNTSGNINGGSIIAIGGAGIGTGARGGLGIATSLSDAYIPTLVAAFATTGALDLKRVNTTTNLYDGTYATFRVSSLINQADDAALTSNGLELSTTNSILFSSTGDYSGAKDTGLARIAAGVVRVSNGSTGIGSLLSSVLVEANTAGSGTPNAIAATESGTTFTNEGVTAKNYEALPTAVAGYQFTFVVQDADGMRIVANTDDTIRVIDKVTAAAGYIESTTIGSTVTLVSVNAVEWYAVSIKGTWTDGTFTYDDTSLTTP